MEIYKNLIVIGTSHISKHSIDEVKKVINENNPDIIAIELDPKRYFALMQKKKQKISIRDIKRFGIKGYLFAMIGSWAEKKLGDYVGVSPGSEIKQAIRLAKKHKKKIAFIDQDIEITLKKLSKAITWEEKWNFVVDIFKAVILRKKEVEFDLTKVPSDKIIKIMMDKLVERYPNIYKVLVRERNEIMASNLKKILEHNPNNKILAIIGVGHMKDTLMLIRNNRQI